MSAARSLIAAEIGQNHLADLLRRYGRGAQAHAAAAIDEERDACRRLIVRLHTHDGSRIAGVGHDEIVRRQRADDATLLVANNGRHRDEVHTRLEGRLRRDPAEPGRTVDEAHEEHEKSDHGSRGDSAWSSLRVEVLATSSSRMFFYNTLARI